MKTLTLANLKQHTNNKNVVKFLTKKLKEEVIYLVKSNECGLNMQYVCSGLGEYTAVRILK